MTVGELLVRLRLDSEEFERRLRDARSTLEATGAKLGKIGKDLSAKVTAPIVGIGTIATKMAVDFDDAMAKVSTIADTTQVPLDSLRTGIMELSNQTGISASEIANNVYDAISAGQSTGDAVAFVEKSTMLAKAGFAEAGQSLDLLTTIMNSYGLEASEVGRVSDVLIQTQAKGKTTVGELSASMGKIIPVADAAGVGLEQLGAAYAIMTNEGIQTAEATTYTNSMLRELTQSGTKASEAVKELSGKSFKELMESGLSVADVLAILDEGAKANGLSLTDMFGSAEAGTAALKLLGDDASKFNGVLTEMENSSGMTAEAFEKLQTNGEQARKAFNNLKNAGIEIGTVLIPILGKIAEKIAEWSLKFSELDDGTKKTIVVIAGLAAAIGPLLVVVASMISAFTTVSAALPALGVAFAAITSPIGLVVIAIGLLIAAGVALYKNWDEVKAFADKIWTGIKDKLSKDWAELTKGIEKLKQNVSETWNSMWTGVVNFLQTSVSNILGKIGAFVTTLLSKWGGMGEEMKQKWDSMWTGVAGILEGVWDRLSSVFERLKSNISYWFTRLAVDAVYWGRNMIQGFVDGINAMIGSVKSAVSRVMDAAKDFIGFRSPSKKGEGRNIVKWGQNMVSGFTDGVESSLPKLQATLSKAIPSLEVGTSGTTNSYGGVTVQNMTVRSDADIDLISRKLFDLQTRQGRGLGII